jgi:hypothetical protein
MQLAQVKHQKQKTKNKNGQLTKARYYFTPQVASLNK